MRKIAIALIGVAAAAIVIVLVFYRVPEQTSGPNGGDGAATSSENFAFSFFDRPRAVPELTMVDEKGRALSIADFHDRPVLLNIWATWCVPCRKEMPSLDRLQAAMGASNLLVLPLSIDRQGLTVVRKFYDELGLSSLAIYLDPAGDAASKLNTVGVPTTLLIDAKGREIGRKIGPAEWDSPEVIALLREHFELSAGAPGASQ